MEPLAPGTPAPPIQGAELEAGPNALFFYKVTCPVCQLTAPKMHVFEDAYPGRIFGVGQDPGPKLERFAGEFGVPFGSVADEPPYDVSNAYGIRVVPTLFVIDGDDIIRSMVESWDRDGFNRASRDLAELTGAAPAVVSEPSDGLPPFRPG
jgi:peroxiredoxin